MSNPHLTAEFCFAVPGESSIIDIVCNDNDGRPISLCAKESLAEVQRRYPLAVIMRLSTFCEQKAARQDAPITWSAIPEEEFEEALNVLPPAEGGQSGFLIGEPYDHHALTGLPRFTAFLARHGQFYKSSRALSRAEFRQFRGPTPAPLVIPSHGSSLASQ